MKALEAEIADHPDIESPPEHSTTFYHHPVAASAAEAAPSTPCAAEISPVATTPPTTPTTPEASPLRFLAGEPLGSPPQRRASARKPVNVATGRIPLASRCRSDAGTAVTVGVVGVQLEEVYNTTR
mmetsp:Transcript_9805/g.24656  ORF Transcript_9805/g.24656 Transcript_9805/m.24656 type:complete len:126 (+) Transcript_9805:1751-2128(+)